MLVLQLLKPLAACILVIKAIETLNVGIIVIQDTSCLFFK